MKYELVCTYDWEWANPSGMKIAFCRSLCHREWQDGDPEPRVVLAELEENYAKTQVLGEKP